MTTFVRAAKHATADPKDHRVHVTGDVLHLGVWVPDLPGTALLYGTGRRSPLCGGNGHAVQVWRSTGPDYSGWDGARALARLPPLPPRARRAAR